MQLTLNVPDAAGIQAVRQIVDAHQLSAFVKMPREMRRGRVEIIVFPIGEENTSGTSLPSGKSAYKLSAKEIVAIRKTKMAEAHSYWAENSISSSELEMIAENDEDIRALSGSLKNSDWNWLPPTIAIETLAMKNIREMRLKEKYGYE